MVVSPKKGEGRPLSVCIPQGVRARKVKKRPFYGVLEERGVEKRLQSLFLLASREPFHYT